MLDSTKTQYFTLPHQFQVDSQGFLGIPKNPGGMVGMTYHSCLFLGVPSREYDGFLNPCGLQVRVPTGTGKGLRFATPRKPVPVTRVEGLVT
jgi:hypothetical protein